MRTFALYFLAHLLALPASRTLGQTGEILSLTDIGLETGYQDTTLGHHKKGRANIAADFDLDGYVDFYIGNPGDESIVLRNVEGTGGQRSFELTQILLIGDLAWGGVSFDYDNDGDYDLFISCGGNEGIGFNYLFRNDWILNGATTGNLQFTDITDVAGVAGPVPQGEFPRGYYFEASQVDDDCGGTQPIESPAARKEWPTRPADRTEPIQTASANAVVTDYDQDGDVDLFVNGNIHDDSLLEYPELIGRNTLWRNNGDGTFTDVTYEAGLGTYLGPTRNSTFLDYDNDGDADLFECNFNGPNILWRNNADGTFTDATSDASMPGHDISYPHKSFASASADLNNDGWEDIIGFMRGDDDAHHGSLYGDGHALFINRGGVFENIAASTVINDNYVAENGVMGCMVRDVSGDGYPDIYVGNGGPEVGVADQFFTSSVEGDIVSYIDNTSLIGFPAVIPDGFPEPPYPYRTHGVAGVDIDLDGVLELTVVNGGTASGFPIVREPNRLFKLSLSTPAFFKVHLIGDGFSVSKDAVGSRVSLEVSKFGGELRKVYRTLSAGSAFPAQDGFDLHFALGDAEQINAMTVLWPNGEAVTITEGLSLNSSITVHYDEVMTGIDGQGTTPETTVLHQNYPNPFNPSTTLKYKISGEALVNLAIYDVLGREVATLVNDVQTAGVYSVQWDASNEASGVYFYRISAGSFVDTRKLVLSK